MTSILCGRLSAAALEDFLRRHDRLALATQANCCALLYVPLGCEVVFISSKKSAHAQALLAAGWANLAIFSAEKLEGLSARGELVATTAAHKAAYFAAHPAARAAVGHELFALKIVYAKYKLGFCKAVYGEENEGK